MLEPSLYFQQTNYLSQPRKDLFTTMEPHLCRWYKNLSSINKRNTTISSTRDFFSHQSRLNNDVDIQTQFHEACYEKV